MDWLLKQLADVLGVEPARSGEAIVPQIRFEQPWPQAVTAAVVVLGSVLIIWLYRREGQVRLLPKMVLAAIRISLLLLIVFMLSEAVLSVERTGLPNFVVLWDLSSSQQIVDHPSDAKVKAALAKLAGEGKESETKNGKSPETKTTTTTERDDPERVDVARGVLLKDKAKLLSELVKQHKLRIYSIAGEASVLAEVDKQEDLPKALAAIRKAQASGDQSRLGVGRPSDPYRAQRRGSDGHCLYRRRPDHRRRAALQIRRARQQEGRAYLRRRSWR